VNGAPPPVATSVKAQCGARPGAAHSTRWWGPLDRGDAGLSPPGRRRWL